MIKILPNFEKTMKEKGYTSAEKFAAVYDKKYPHYKKDSVCNSSSKFRKLQGGEGNPDITSVVQICDLLECDVDYLLDRIEEPTHEDKYIHDHTGLSEAAIQNIKKLDKMQLSALNLLLESPQFCVYFLRELYDYEEMNAEIYALKEKAEKQWKKIKEMDNSALEVENYNNNASLMNDLCNDIRSYQLDLYERSVRVLDQINRGVNDRVTKQNDQK